MRSGAEEERRVGCRWWWCSAEVDEVCGGHRQVNSCIKVREPAIRGRRVRSAASEWGSRDWKQQVGPDGWFARSPASASCSL